MRLTAGNLPPTATHPSQPRIEGYASLPPGDPVWPRQVVDAVGAVVKWVPGPHLQRCVVEGPQLADEVGASKPVARGVQVHGELGLLGMLPADVQLQHKPAAQGLQGKGEMEGERTSAGEEGCGLAKDARKETVAWAAGVAEVARTQMSTMA